MSWETSETIVRQKRKPGRPKGSKNRNKQELMQATLVTMQQNFVKIQDTPEETDDQIATRLAKTFKTLEIMANASCDGFNRAMIVSGPAGIGKSEGINRALAKREAEGDINFVSVKGYVRATGLYKVLYENQESSNVIVFDDADSIFYDDVSLNLLKAATDTTKKRELFWLTEGKMYDQDDELLPNRFTFEGSIIFITNIDFDAMANSGNKLAPHMAAMMSRAHYLNVNIKTPAAYLVRIKQVMDSGMISHLVSREDEQIIFEYIKDNAARLRELSLRVVIKITDMYLMTPDWRDLVECTLMRN